MFPGSKRGPKLTDDELWLLVKAKGRGHVDREGRTPNKLRRKNNFCVRMMYRGYLSLDDDGEYRLTHKGSLYVIQNRHRVEDRIGPIPKKEDVEAALAEAIGPALADVALNGPKVQTSEEAADAEKFYATVSEQRSYPPMTHYEYAGFDYDVFTLADGSVRLTPAPGQHPAAGKDKHLRNATEMYLSDNKKDRRR